LVVSSLNRENSEIFVKRLREKGYNAFVADSLHDLFIKSDVISSATNSRQPFIKAEYIKDGLQPIASSFRAGMNRKIYNFSCSNYHDDESIDVVASKPLRDAR